MKVVPVARRLIGALMLSAAVALPRPVHAQEHALIQAINRVFERSQTDDFKEYGLDNSQFAPGAYSHSIKGCWLKKGEGKINTPTLEPGVEYAVIAGGDNSATKIKLSALNPGEMIRAANNNDPVMTESTEENNMLGITIRVNKRQGVGIRIRLDEVDENSGKESAYCAFVILRKEGGWDVPLENMKTAAANLQKRLDKIREANEGSADLAYAWFSIHGGVVPKGKITENGHTLNKGTDYVLVAASDGNTDDVAFTYDGLLRVPKDEEVADDGLKVSYKRGLQRPFTAVHQLKNNGETSLILVAVVQIIKAG
jgi:hypothetical protein